MNIFQVFHECFYSPAGFGEEQNPGGQTRPPVLGRAGRVPGQGPGAAREPGGLWGEEGGIWGPP